MRKKCYMVVLMLCVVMMATGCGKSSKKEPEKTKKEALADEYQKDGFTKEEAEELAEITTELFGDEEKLDEQNNETEVATEQELKKFDRSTEWETIIDKYTAIQIDDKIYRTGVLVSELMANVETSEAGYEYEYNSEKLVGNGDYETIVINRNGIPWFEVRVMNLKEQAEPLKNALVEKIKLCNDENNGTIEDYIYFWGGKSENDFLGMSLDDIRKLKNMFPDQEESFEYKESSDGGYIECAYRMEATHFRNDKGDLATSITSFVFYVSQDLNQVEYIDFYINVLTRGGQIDGAIHVNQIDEIDKEVAINTPVHRARYKNSNNIDKLILKTMYCGVTEQQGNRINRFAIIYEMTRNEKTKYYVYTFYGGMSDCGVIADTIGNGLSGSGWEFDTYEEAVHLCREVVLDEITSEVTDIDYEIQYE